jgi:hypothetical protein
MVQILSIPVSNPGTVPSNNLSVPTYTSGTVPFDVLGAINNTYGSVPTNNLAYSSNTYGSVPNSNISYSTNTTGSVPSNNASVVSNTSGTVPSNTQTASVANAYPQLPKTGGGGRGVVEKVSYSYIVYWSGGVILLLMLGFLYFRKPSEMEQEVEFKMGV